MIALETKTPSLRSASPTAKKASLPYSGAHLAPPIDETWNQKGLPCGRPWCASSGIRWLRYPPDPSQTAMAP